MINNGLGNIEAFPACQSGSNTYFAVIGIGKEILLKKTYPIEQAFPVHGSAPRWEKNLLHHLILSIILFKLPLGPAQTVPVNEFPYSLNSFSMEIGTNFRAPHSDRG